MPRDPTSARLQASPVLRDPLLRSVLIAVLLCVALWLRMNTAGTNTLFELHAWTGLLWMALALMALPFATLSGARCLQPVVVVIVGCVAFHALWDALATRFGFASDAVAAGKLVVRDLIVLGGAAGLGLRLQATRRRARMAELITAVERKLARAELKGLQGQLNPHLLANTLNSVVGLLNENRTSDAIRMIVQTEAFLRSVLEKADAAEVLLREEISLLESYVSIQQLRFERELELVTEVAEEAWDCLVPRLCLQPLAENAIVHGFRGLTLEKPVLVIRAWCEKSHLVLELSDNGVGASSQREGRGHGLRNVRERLQILYGSAAALTVRYSRSGTTSHLLLPCLRRNECQVKKTL